MPGASHSGSKPRAPIGGGATVAADRPFSQSLQAGHQEPDCGRVDASQSSGDISDDAKAITGNTIFVDAGYHIVD